MQPARYELFAFIGALALAFCGCDTKTAPIGSKDSTTPSTVASSEKQDAPKSDAKSPDTVEGADAIKLTELTWDDLQKTVASHKGKVVVVDIWSTSCEPCLREFPHLVELQKRHPDDVVCISFDCDFIGAKNKPVSLYRERVLKQLVSQHAEILINGMSTVAADELFEKLAIDSIPAVYVYDRTGKVAKRFDNTTPAGGGDEGISYEKQIDPLVADLIKAEKN